MLDIINEIKQTAPIYEKQLKENSIDSLLSLLSEGDLPDAGLQTLCDTFTNDLSKEVEQPDYLLSANNVGFIPKGDLQAIKGMAKHGKSFLCSILVASILGADHFEIKANHQHTRVIYFDTEQNTPNTIRLIKRIHTLLGWNECKNNPRLKNYSLRTFTPLQRTNFIKQVTREEKPDAIIVDGIADLINDFNNIAESQQITLDLMKLSKEVNCACICVLHTAKTSLTGEMKGHLGSLLLQKVSDCFEVKKQADELLFDVSQSETRNTPIDKFTFTINENGIPEQADEYQARKAKEQSEKQANELREYFKQTFDNSICLSYSELWTKLQVVINQSERTAKYKISQAIQQKIIEKDNANNYYLLS